MTEVEPEAPRVRRKLILTGKVVRSKTPKTVVVAVVRRSAHAVYKRGIKRTRRFLAHDEAGKCRVGDEVTIVESRPLSRLKRWRIGQIVRQGEAR